MIRIRARIAIALLLTITVSTAFAHMRGDGSKPKKKVASFINLRETTIGFYRSNQIFDVSRNGYTAKNKPLSSSGVVVRMPIVKHFKAEIRFDFPHMVSQMKEGNNPADRSSAFPFLGNAGTTANFTMPVSIDYFFLPTKSRIQPYFGAGTVVYTDMNRMLSFSDNSEPTHTTPGTKYISLMINQGIIFEVNPKIQVTESIHLINNGPRTSLDLSFGIGFKF